MDISKEISSIDWSNYKTAYGSAEKNIPIYLQWLFSGDTAKSMEATHYLWCSLCHQHSYASSAALPAYDILLYGLQTLDDKIKVELLDIFWGFALCIGDENSSESWQGQVRKKLKRDIPLFESLMTSPNEDIVVFAENIYGELTGDV